MFEIQINGEVIVLVESFLCVSDSDKISILLTFADFQHASKVQSQRHSEHFRPRISTF